MKHLRKKCVRCQKEIIANDFKKGDENFTCSGCHSISSIYEERDFTFGANAQTYQNLRGISFDFLGSDLYIQMGKLPSGEMIRSIFGTGVILIILIFIFFLTDSTSLLWLTSTVGSTLWLINLLIYLRIDNRTYEVELSAYQVVFYEKLFGIKRVLKSINSYEVDRIQVITKPNSGLPGTNRTDFFIQTKQYKKIKPFYHSAKNENKLKYLKCLMDNYLNIQERASDIQA